MKTAAPTAAARIQSAALDELCSRTPLPALIGRTLAPVVVVIGNDRWPAAETSGPQGWGCARCAKRWVPRGVIVHGTGGHHDHYRAASEAAFICRRLLVVETDSAHIRDWAEYLNCAGTLLVRPLGGNVHPEPPPREAMQ